MHGYSCSLPGAVTDAVSRAVNLLLKYQSRGGVLRRVDEPLELHSLQTCRHLLHCWGGGLPGADCIAAASANAAQVGSVVLSVRRDWGTLGCDPLPAAIAKRQLQAGL